MDMGDATALYLDLLKRCLTNWIYGDSGKNGEKRRQFFIDICMSMKNWRRFSPFFVFPQRPRYHFPALGFYSGGQAASKAARRIGSLGPDGSQPFGGDNLARCLASVVMPSTRCGSKSLTSPISVPITLDSKEKGGSRS